MVFSAFEAFVGYISSREGRAHADESGVRIGPEVEERLVEERLVEERLVEERLVEERLRQRLLGRGGGTEAKAREITPEGSTALKREKPS
jgi:hypothetical protein